MTLEPYDASKLDALAMRFLDLAATFRRMAQDIRQEGVENVAMHATRPLDYMSRLDQWARDAEARLQIEMIRSRADRLGKDETTRPRKTRNNARNKSNKK